MLKNIDKSLTNTIIWIIKGYQKIFSPDHSKLGKCFPYRGCRFHPTCSEYGIQTLQKKGFARGIGPVIWRVLKCNPWHAGGIDLPK